jgi:hypothetical protein
VTIENSYKFKALQVVLLWSVCSLTASAKILEVGVDREYKNPCDAIHAAAPGDVIVLARETFSGSCAWRTPGLTIRGEASDSVIRVEADRTTWQIGADNTVIQSLSFIGAGTAEATGAAIQQAGGNLTLRHVRIEGAAIGVESLEAEGATLTIEQSEISANQRNVVVGAISEFSLYNSYLHDAKGGDSLDTAALRNNIRQNKLTSAAELGTRHDLVIRESESSRIERNLIDRSGPADSGVLIQYVSDSERAGALEILGNTFVSSTAGVFFVEAVGTTLPRVQIEKNVFWGGLIAEALGHDAANSNFFGAAPELTRTGEPKLAPESVPADWGAPLELLGVDAVDLNGSRVSYKTTALALVAAPTLQSVVLSKTNFVGGSYLKATVYLTSAAPAGGVYAKLSSSNPAILTPLISTILIPAGATSAPVVIFSKPVSTPTSVTITATAAGVSQKAIATLTPVALLSVTLEKTEIGSNGKLMLNRVNLNGPAPAGGMIVYLSESSSAISAPAYVTIVAGANSVNFTITAGAVTSAQPVTITARFLTIQRSATLTVNPLGIEKLELFPTTAYGGQFMLLKASLNAPTSTGVTVYLSSSDSTITVPATIFAAAGKSYASAVLYPTAVSSARSITLSARTGSTTKSQVVTVIPK